MTTRASGGRARTRSTESGAAGARTWWQGAVGYEIYIRSFVYLWGQPAADGGPPNNWVSHFGGPAWTFDEATGEYWLHLFLPEQPDPNWSNPRVAAVFDEILRFWLDRGVDGFRVDAAHALTKDPHLRDNPLRAAPSANASAHEIWSAH